MRIQFRNLAISLSLLTLIAGTGCKEDSPTGPATIEPFIVTYSFTSGMAGDEFDWPPGPQGLIDDIPTATYFTTPHGMRIQNDTGNNLFFDANTLLPKDGDVGNGLVDECLWGDPRPINNETVAESIVMYFNVPVDSVAFDFAWVIGGDTVPDSLFFGVRSGTEGAIIGFYLPDAWNAGAPYQNSTGRSGHIEFNLATLASQFDLDYGSISHITFFTEPVSQDDANAVFALDNLTIAKFE